MATELTRTTARQRRKGKLSVVLVIALVLVIDRSVQGCLGSWVVLPASQASTLAPERFSRAARHFDYDYAYEHEMEPVEKSARRAKLLIVSPRTSFDTELTDGQNEVVGVPIIQRSMNSTP